LWKRRRQDRFRIGATLCSSRYTATCLSRSFFSQPIDKEKTMDKPSASLLGEMSIMDSSGHKQLTWNTERLDEIVKAQETFDQLIEDGYFAFASEKKMGTKHVISKFDPTMEEMIMVPRNVGG
jgi:hypothetical protein